MDLDYKNFVERMGSFEYNLDITDDNKDLRQSSMVGKRIVTRNRSAVTDSNVELQHFGIRGMKWGHHKAINANVIGKAAKTGQDLASLGQTINKTGYNKKALTDAKHLSDDDLKRLTNRLNLENNYINAMNQQSGRSKVESILTTAGSALAVASSAAVLYETIRKFKG